MLELTFFDTTSTPKIISVSEHCYERLAEIGFSKKVDYKNNDLTIEGESYSINSVELTEENRKTLLALIEGERQEELEKIFRQIDENPTIKEIRENLFYVKELTEIYKALKAEGNIYFSYE
ncbi:hypothetical protein DZC30_22430 [Comamonas testosteroni]|uniref:Uncharacterized protein n=1 Tax=Comamonas testosteroni TaxID=285 RepID=A0A373F680_COMTE|nr:hypothetical protein [Comamonas testosteroni]RGE39032.1 hypothetical protein DZC30_22430 [Comamonas testosteroni]